MSLISLMRLVCGECEGFVYSAIDNAIDWIIDNKVDVNLKPLAGYVGLCYNIVFLAPDQVD